MLSAESDRFLSKEVDQKIQSRYNTQIINDTSRFESLLLANSVITLHKLSKSQRETLILFKKWQDDVFHKYKLRNDHMAIHISMKVAHSFFAFFDLATFSGLSLT